MNYSAVKKTIFILISAILSLFIFNKCSINEPKIPRWDVSLNVPIAKKNYTLYDIVEKKSSEIQHYTDGEIKDILYYSDVKLLEKITVNEELKISDISERKEKQIGAISIAADSVNTSIGYEWLGIQVTPGSNEVLPAVNNVPISVNFNSAEQFQSARIESGNVELYITNNMPSPVEITLNNLTIKNTAGGEVVVNGAASASVQSLQTAKISSMHIVSGVLIKNQLTLTGNISNTSSNGQSITLPNHSLTVKAVLKNVKVTEAIAKIPEQEPVIVEGSVAIDEDSSQPTKFQNVKLGNGKLNVTLTNNLNVDASATVTILNLVNPNGAAFTATKDILRKSVVNVFDNLSLADYSFISLGNGPTNVVHYKISFVPLSTNDYRQVTSSDQVLGEVSFADMEAKEFMGQLKPTLLKTTRTSFSLDVEDLKDKLEFQELNLKNPIIELRLRPSAQFEFSIDGRMEAKNSIGQRSIMTLSSRTLSTNLITRNDTIITLNPDSVSNFFKKFSEFPDSIIVYAEGMLNPNYKTISVSMSDEVTGKSRIEFPFEFGISGGEITDSIEVDLSEDDRDKIKDLKSFDASLTIANGIPAQFSFAGKLYDEYNNFLMYFPPKHDDQDTVVSISGASTDSKGNVISEAQQTVNIKTVNGEPDKLSRAKYMRIKLKFNTSGQNNVPVKFKTDDTINISIAGTIDYRVKE